MSLYRKSTLLLWLCSASMAVSVPLAARALGPADCAQTPPALNATVTEGDVECANKHAEYMYAHRCTDDAGCEEPAIMAYRTASRIFNRYLIERSKARQGMQTEVQQAHDSLWRGILEEHAHEYRTAVRDYDECRAAANKTRPTDTVDLTPCESGLHRIYCHENQDAKVCSNDVSYEVEHAGGSVSSALDSDVLAEGARVVTHPSPPDNSPSLTMPLPEPPDAAETERTISAQEKRAIQDAIRQRNLVFTPVPKNYGVPR
jgi:hypothetical protein